MANKRDTLASPFVPEEEQPYSIPKNWCWEYGVSIFMPMETQKPNGEMFRYIDIESIDNKQQAVSEPKEMPVTKAPSRASRKLHSGDTIFSMVRPYLKNIAYIDETVSDAIASTGFYICTPRENVNSRYNYYMMISPYVVDGLNAFMKGDNSPSIRKDDIEGFPYPIPPLLEQQRIVDCIESLFAKLDEAKEKAQVVVDGSELRKSAILHKAFTGELTERWRKEHGVGLDSWTQQKLKDTTIQIIDGDRGTSYPKKHDFSSGGYCVFLNAKNVTKSGFRFEQLEFISTEKDEELRSGKLVRGDIILTTRGTIGNVAIYDNNVPYEHLRINSGMVIFRNGIEFYKSYIVWLFQSRDISSQIRKLQTGSAQPQLPIKVMKELLLPIPSVAEQVEIVRLLNYFIYKEQQSKEAAEAVLTQIDTMKKAILAHAFRGEMGTNDPAEEWAGELVKER